MEKKFLTELELLKVYEEMGYNFRKGTKKFDDLKNEKPFSELTIGDKNVDWDRLREKAKEHHYKVDESNNMWYMPNFINIESLSEKEVTDVFRLISKELGIYVEYDTHEVKRNHVEISSKPIDLVHLGIFGYCLESAYIYIYNHNSAVDEDAPIMYFFANIGYNFKSLGSNGNDLCSSKGRVRVKFDLVKREWTVLSGQACD